MIRDAAAADEPVTICDYDPFWPAPFDSEQICVAKMLGDRITRIEHFGSSAVPGVAGEPIVDLLVGVRMLAEGANCVHELEALGYESFGELFIVGRLYLRKRGPPNFNIALAADGGEFWNVQITLRNFLRTHPAEAAAYAAIKRSTYDSGARLLSTYSRAKEPYLAALQERARSWLSRNS